MKIFLLEDDKTLGFGIKTYLENSNYTVSHASSLNETKERFNYDFDFLKLKDEKLNYKGLVLDEKNHDNTLTREKIRTI